MPATPTGWTATIPTWRWTRTWAPSRWAWPSSAGRPTATAGSASGCSWPRWGALLMLGRYTFLFDVAPPRPDPGQLAHPGPLPPLGHAGRRRAGGRRRRPAGAAGPGPAPRGGRHRRGARGAVGADPGVRLRPGLDRADPLDGSPITSPATAGWGASSPGRRRGRSAWPCWPGAWPRRPPGRPRPGSGPRLAALLPVLVIADLLGAHWSDVPTVPPAYWTEPPPAARRLRADPAFVRVYRPGGPLLRRAGLRLASRSTSSRPATRWPGACRRPGAWPPRRRDADDLAPEAGFARLHGAGRPAAGPVRPGGGHAPRHRPTRRRGRGRRASRRARRSSIRNPGALPRARLMGRPVYAADEADGGPALGRLGAAARDRAGGRGPRPPPGRRRRGRAGRPRSSRDEPERVEVATDVGGRLVPGPGRHVRPRLVGHASTAVPAPIRPAYVAFRAVYVPAGPARGGLHLPPGGLRRRPGRSAACGVLVALAPAGLAAAVGAARPGARR